MEEQITKNEHYVPCMYLKNFRAKITNADIRAKKDMLSCYQISKDKTFNTIEDTLYFEKFLYEYDMENDCNGVEKRFCELVEGPISIIIDDLLKRCECAKDGDCVLSSEEISNIYAYVTIQTFRHKISIEKIVPLFVKKTKETTMEFSDTTLTGAWLYMLSDLKSPFVEKGREELQSTHDLFIIKSDKQHFCTSDYPVFFDFQGNFNEETCTGDNWFVYSDIIFPISPQYCIIMSRKTSDIGGKNGLFYEQNILDIDNIITVLSLSSDIIVSDCFTNEMIATIKNNRKLYLQQVETMKKKADEYYSQMMK